MAEKKENLNENEKDAQNIEEEVNEKEEVNEETKSEETKCSDEAENKEENANKEDAPEEKIKELEMFNKKVKEENKKLNNELEAVKEKLLRMSAEYENYRKRTAKEKEGIYTDACSDVLKEMFPVLDNLERAANASGDAEELKKGVEMTVRQFKDSLTKLNVEEVATSEGFDPNLHNAVMHVDDDNYGEKEIVEVFQKGYKKGEKVLRYSMVKVAN